MILQGYKTKNGIKKFCKDVNEDHADYNAQGLHNLYKVEEKHFWFIARKEFIAKEMQAYIKKSAHIIEIGAGTGNVARYLMHQGYTNLSVGEMHLNGLHYAKHYGIQECYQFDLLHSPFKEEFDCVCLFDVLEHIENDTLALQNVYQMLIPRGFLVLTVPAHMWLWNREDRVAGHKRRYSKKELVKKLTQNGFLIEKVQFFFIFIIPLLFLRKLLQKDDGKMPSNTEFSKKIHLNPIVNYLLLKICRFENRLHRFLPNKFGGSILIIARKR